MSLRCTLAEQPADAATCDAWIARAVCGRTFIEVGGLWGTSNEKITVAARAGATEATMIDITPLGSELWQRFDERCGEAGVSGYRCVQADIADGAQHTDLGADVVFCSGVVYHCPQPFAVLATLAGMARDTLIVGSTVVPPEISNGAGKLRVTPGAALFVPALDERQRAVIAEHFAEVGAHALGIHTPCEWNVSDYAPWWWCFTIPQLVAMVEVLGFEAQDTCTHWDGRACYLYARRR